MTKYRRDGECETGTKCGRACISKMFSCVSSLSAQGQAVAGRLVAFARNCKQTANSDKMSNYTDTDGKQWIAKRFNNAAWEREIRAYTEAERLGISAMLVRPKFISIDSGEHEGQVMALWPKLEGQTLRDYLNSGGKMTAVIKQGLAIARQYDEVIRNPDRNAGNVWITKAGKVKLIDQDQAYGSIGVLSHASNMTLSEAQAIWKL